MEVPAKQLTSKTVNSDRKPRFDGTVNLGHVLTMITMLVGGLLVWTQSLVVQAKQDVRISHLEETQRNTVSAINRISEAHILSLRNQDKINNALEYVLKNKIAVP